MAREGLMDDTGYHGYDAYCPLESDEEPTEEYCKRCASWKDKEGYCEVEWEIIRDTEAEQEEWSKYYNDTRL